MHCTELTCGGGDISVLSRQWAAWGASKVALLHVCISSNNINVIIIEIVIFVTTPIIMWAAWSIAVTTGIL